MSRSLSGMIQKRKTDCRKLMAHEKREIDEINSKLHASRLGIVDEGILKPFMTLDHFNSLCTSGSQDRKSHILEWLGINTTSSQFVSDMQNSYMLENDPLFSAWKQIILNHSSEMDQEQAVTIEDPWAMPLDKRVDLYRLWARLTGEKVELLVSEGRKKPLSRHVQTSEFVNFEECQNISQLIENDILDEDQLIKFLPNNLKPFILEMKRCYPLPLFRKANQTVIQQWICLDGTEESRQFIYDAMKKMLNGEDDLIDIEEDAAITENGRIIDDEYDDEFVTKEMKQNDQFLEIALEDLAVVAFDSNSKGNGDATEEQDEWITVKSKERQRKLIRKILFGTEFFSEDEMEDVEDIWNLTFDERAKVYRFWLLKYQQYLRDLSQDTEKRYSDACESYREAKDMEDAELIRGRNVVAMTTTGAAKFRVILQTIKPRIIIVEEAAEVLESHIITTLNPDCEHLILIGDHKQLRPSPTVYDLATTYNLEISLFERMINNKVCFETLELQHRMRPEISTLMQHIYPGLRDDPSVSNFPKILGIDDNFFFITHEHEEHFIEETKSRSNAHEAELAVELCRYFINQGYNPEQITILTTYSGQFFEIKRLMPRRDFQGVRLTPVDNFQGEENDIIILSLVRSNREGSIGFLSVENRVCVALSRARKGFYIFGNMNLLASKSPIWENIEATLKDQQAIGPKLWLRCQNHREQKTAVSKAADFDQCRGDGCREPCSAKLKCGHACEKTCHIVDKEHKFYNCLKTCGKQLCSEGHKCKKKCFKTCGPCIELVEKMHPVCLHTQKMPCHVNPYTYECREACTFNLLCGHKCQGICGVCRKDGVHRSCEVLCERKWPCGHIVETPCYQQPIKYACPKKCEITLDCGHKCKGMCRDCFEGRIHIPCQEKCKQILICGHVCNQACGVPCSTCVKNCQNKCNHSKCKDRCGVACNKCREKCEYSCKHYSCTKLCGEFCDRLPCDSSCEKKIQCNHQCMGLCGEPCPQICYLCNESKAKKIYPGCREDTKFIQLEDCRHIFESTSMDKWILKRDINRTAIFVEMLACPKCNKPIANSHRYGRVIKSLKENVEKVKETMYRKEPSIHYKKQEICKRLKQTSLDQTSIEKILTSLNETMLSPDFFNVIENQIIFLTWLDDIAVLVKNRSQFFSGEDNERKNLEQCIDRVKARIFETKVIPNKTTGLITSKRKSFRGVELHEINSEILRLEFAVKFSIHNLDVNFSLNENTKELLLSILRILNNGKALDSRKEITMRSCFRRLELLKSSTSDEFEFNCPERRVLVENKLFIKGMWCKCLCGNVFGLQEVVKTYPFTNNCPACKQLIEIHSINDEVYHVSSENTANEQAEDSFKNVKKPKIADKPQWKTVKSAKESDKIKQEDGKELSRWKTKSNSIDKIMPAQNDKAEADEPSKQPKIKFTQLSDIKTDKTSNNDEADIRSESKTRNKWRTASNHDLSNLPSVSSQSDVDNGHCPMSKISDFSNSKMHKEEDYHHKPGTKRGSTWKTAFDKLPGSSEKIDRNEISLCNEAFLAEGSGDQKVESDHQDLVENPNPVNRKSSNMVKLRSKMYENLKCDKEESQENENHELRHIQLNTFSKATDKEIVTTRNCSRNLEPPKFPRRKNYNTAQKDASQNEANSEVHGSTPPDYCAKSSLTCIKGHTYVNTNSREDSVCPACRTERITLIESKDMTRKNCGELKTETKSMRVKSIGDRWADFVQEEKSEVLNTNSAPVSAFNRRDLRSENDSKINQTGKAEPEKYKMSPTLSDRKSTECAPEKYCSQSKAKIGEVQEDRFNELKETSRDFKNSFGQKESSDLGCYENKIKSKGQDIAQTETQTHNKTQTSEHVSKTDSSVIDKIRKVFSGLFETQTPKNDMLKSSKVDEYNLKKENIERKSHPSKMDKTYDHLDKARLHEGNKSKNSDRDDDEVESEEKILSHEHSSGKSVPSASSTERKKEKEVVGKRRAVSTWFRCKKGHLYNKQPGEKDMDVCTVCGDDQGKLLF